MSGMEQVQERARLQEYHPNIVRYSLSTGLGSADSSHASHTEVVTESKQSDLRREKAEVSNVKSVW